MWTFGRKIAAGFALSFLLLLGIGAVAYQTTESLTRTSYKVAHTHIVMEHIAGVLLQMINTETGQRGFLLTGEDVYLEPYTAGVSTVAGLIKDLRGLTADNRVQQERLNKAEGLIASRLEIMKRGIELRRAATGLEAAAKLVQDGEGKKIMDDLRTVLGEMEHEERELLKVRFDEAESAAALTRSTIIYGTAFCLLLTCAIGTLITRSLTSQVGSAVRHIQGSSTELQAAANQQVMGAKESSTSMNEIATTISELLATSRQIAESAQRVVSIAEQTAGAALSGEGTVLQTSDSITGIRRQVDLIVGHMLDLGRKSQQIGAVLEIVSELAEQTNILAINATIEAAGAGENGRRFAVVADEIRKLADRVAGSTKEIRGLIDDVRSAVNTTVMATETGSKAVDDGNRRFAEVTTSFKQIAELVSTTTEASREIELSTKQQTSAVEQVNIAIASISQATKETEASSGQILQTASQLAALSRDLHQLISPHASSAHPGA